MEAKTEVYRLIAKYGGVGRLDGGHYVYSFPNNPHKLTIASTTVNRESWHRTLAHLKRIVGIRPMPGDIKPTAPQQENGMSTMQEALKHALEEPEATTDSSDATPTPTDVSENRSPMRQRIDAKIEVLESRRSDIQREIDDRRAQIAAVETDLEKMAKLLVLCDDPGMEDLLSTLLTEDTKTKSTRATRNVWADKKTLSCPQCGKVIRGNPANLQRHMSSVHRAAEPAPTTAATAAPPEAITRGVDVNRQLVLACTQTFGDGETFTTRNVIDRMIGGRKIDAAEESRVAVSVSSAMTALSQEGLVKLILRAQGRRPASWRKVDLTHLPDSRLKGARG